MLDEMQVNDEQLEVSDIRRLESADEIAHFFARLRYDVDERTNIPDYAALGMGSEDMRQHIHKIELIGKDPEDGDISIYLSVACILYIRLLRQKDISMAKQYVEQREDVYWVADTRVSLDSIVYAFLEGQTAESIAQSFPVLTLEQVYGAITFYLANRSDIDAYLRREEAEFETLRQAWRTQDAMFYQKMADARRQRQTIQP